MKGLSSSTPMKKIAAAVAKVSGSKSKIKYCVSSLSALGSFGNLCSWQDLPTWVFFLDQKSQNSRKIWKSCWRNRRRLSRSYIFVKKIWCKFFIFDLLLKRLLRHHHFSNKTFQINNIGSAFFLRQVNFCSISIPLKI